MKWNFGKDYLKNFALRTDLWLPSWEGDGGEMDGAFGVSRCKLLHIKWINNKDLLCSTGKYIQYPMINYNGKEC